jgi:FkbM family methyltransferase
MTRPLPPVSVDPVNGLLLQRLLGPDPRVILEVGANHGQHTQLFLRTFPSARIHAFEPDPRAIEAFRRQVSDRRVTLHEIAIGAANGRAQFHASNGFPPDATPDVKAAYPKGWDQSGSLRKPKTHVSKWPWCRFPRTIGVDVRTLDTWSGKHEPGPIDFIWADMQGAEGDLVAGGRETLALPLHRVLRRRALRRRAHAHRAPRHASRLRDREALRVRHPAAQRADRLRAVCSASFGSRLPC